MSIKNESSDNTFESKYIDDQVARINEEKNRSKLKSSQLMYLFEEDLKDIFCAENALVKALPKMIKNATSKELNRLLTAHLQETRKHIIRLKKVFALIDLKLATKHCEEMESLINEAFGIMASYEKGWLRDVGIISTTQKIELYEIASYATLRQVAQKLELSKVVELLEKTLKEEKNADLNLSNVAIIDIDKEVAKEAENTTKDKSYLKKNRAKRINID